ncbi:MAG: MerR family transcriptional regulator [Rhizomicrobium sp.]
MRVGRRYYRPEDVDLLRGIRALLYREGYTIKGAQKVIRDNGLRHVADLGRAANAKPVNIAPVFIEPESPRPRHARAVLAVVELAHAIPPEPEQAVEDSSPSETSAAEEAEKPHSLAAEEHTRLEALLGELEQMKARLRGAMPRRA